MILFWVLLLLLIIFYLWNCVCLFHSLLRIISVVLSVFDFCIEFMQIIEIIRGKHMNWNASSSNNCNHKMINWCCWVFCFAWPLLLPPLSTTKCIVYHWSFFPPYFVGKKDERKTITLHDVNQPAPAPQFLHTILLICLFFFSRYFLFVSVFTLFRGLKWKRLLPFIYKKTTTDWWAKKCALCVV